MTMTRTADIALNKTTNQACHCISGNYKLVGFLNSCILQKQKKKKKKKKKKTTLGGYALER